MREERLRAIGRQLNEEADRRREAEAAAPPDTPKYWQTLRRGRIFGYTDASEELVRYAQAFARKVEQNMTFELVREAAKQRHQTPVVTVSIRADGTVESVRFVVPSGVPEIDDAIREIVRSQANYPAFSPALAREFDVVEIRRTWSFDTSVRLH